MPHQTHIPPPPLRNLELHTHRRERREENELLTHWGRERERERERERDKTQEKRESERKRKKRKGLKEKMINHPDRAMYHKQHDTSFTINELLVIGIIMCWCARKSGTFQKRFIHAVYK